MILAFQRCGSDLCDAFAIESCDRGRVESRSDPAQDEAVAIELHRDNVRLDLLLDVSTAPRMVDITKLHTTSHIAVAPFL